MPHVVEEGLLVDSHLSKFHRRRYGFFLRLIFWFALRYVLVAPLQADLEPQLHDVNVILVRLFGYLRQRQFIRKHVRSIGEPQKRQRLFGRSKPIGAASLPGQMFLDR